MTSHALESSNVPVESASIGTVSDQTAGSRILSLDVLRGIAVLGALVISIWGFGGFTGNKQHQLLLNPHGLNYGLFALVSFLIEGKMLLLISLVFGAGMVIFLTKPGKKEQAPKADLLIRRQMWLMGLGLINALVFLWTGDVLFHLGIMGILIFPFVRLRQRGLFIAAIITILIFCGKNCWNYSDDQRAYRKYVAVTAFEKKIKQDSIQNAKKAGNTVAAKPAKKDTLTSEQKDDKAAWEGLLKRNKYDPKKDSAENTAMQKIEYGEIWSHLLPVTQSKEAEWTYKTGVWDIAGMMLLGMALFKAGFFNNRFNRKSYLLLALAGLTLGLLLAWMRMHYNQQSVLDYTEYIKRYWFPYNFFFPFEKAFIAVGYASLVMALLQARVLSWLWKAFASVGRIALTNYLLQSIICSLFFTGYGMGYFGRLQQYQLYMLVAEICLVQIIFSVLWLRFYKHGPFEWLWRCATYKKWISIKRYPEQTTETALPDI